MTIIDRLVVVLGFRHDPTGLAQFRKSTAKAQATLGRVSRVAAKGGLVLTGFAVGAVKSFATFEAEMAKIEGLVGISREQLDAWRGDLSAIARETGQAPVELAKALFYVTSAGLRGSYAIDVLRSSAMASAAGLGDQATVADLLTSAMNAYGVESLSAVDATNALTEAVRLGKLEPASLAGAMGRVLPVASAMGVKFNEVAGLMAAMSKTGTDATTATTQLNAIMLQLLKPSDGAKKAYERVGTSAEELRKVVAEKGLFEALIKIRTAFGENNQALVEVFPNIRALRGIFDLLGPQLDSNRALLDEMADSTGVLDEAFSAAEETLRFKWRRMMAVVQDGMIRLGEVLAPSFAKLIGWIEAVAEWFNNLGDRTKKAISILLLAGVALLALAAALKVVAIMISVVSGLAVVIKGVAIAVNLLAISLKFLAAGGLLSAISVGLQLITTGLFAVLLGLKALTVAIWVFLTTNPVGWILLLIVALAAGAYAIYRFRDAIVGALTSTWGWVVGFVKKWYPLIIGIIFPFFGAVAAVWYFRDAIVGALTSTWGWVVGFVKKWYPLIIGIIFPFFGAVAAVWYFRDAIVGALTSTWGWVVGFVKKWYPLIIGIIFPFFGAVAAVWYFRDAIVGALTSAWRWLVNLTEKFHDVGRGIVEAIVDGIKSAAQKLLDTVKGLFAKVRKFLPFSDAKVGPLADLTESGRRFSETFARGVAAGANSVPPSVLRALPHPQTILAPLRAPPQTSGVTGGSRTLTISVGDINIHADGGDPRRIAAEIGDAIRDEFRSVAEEFDSQERA